MDRFRLHMINLDFWKLQAHATSQIKVGPHDETAELAGLVTTHSFEFPAGCLSLLTTGSLIPFTKT